MRPGIADRVNRALSTPGYLKVPELTVKFQTDVRRGYETIENPGLIEPYLKKAAAYLQSTFKGAPGVPAAASVAKAAAAAAGATYVAAQRLTADRPQCVTGHGAAVERQDDRRFRWGLPAQRIGASQALLRQRKASVLRREPDPCR